MATAETTVREIALDQPASIRVFERLGLIIAVAGANRSLRRALTLTRPAVGPGRP